MDIPIWKKVDPFPTPYTKVNSIWITDINLRVQNIKPIEENREVNLYEFGLGMVVLDMTTKA